MEITEEVGRLRRLSDDELLAGLNGVLGSSRKLMALLIAHLAEVEERRLHLIAGFGSMFAYCTERLGLSEDEAFRRIHVARLAQRFPILIAELAGGHISLSVAALLETRLTDANHRALLAAVAGKTVTRAREVLATWFPQPDVPTVIRKLPERRIGAPSASTEVSAPARSANASSGSLSPPLDSTSAESEASSSSSSAWASAPADDATGMPAAKASSRQRIERAARPVEPLSPGRFKVQFTADAELKRKLELARDLLRHAVPHGDLAAIVGRALDLLIEKTLQRRFAKTTRPAQPPEPERARRVSIAKAADPGPTAAAAAPEPPSIQRSRHLPNEVRRAVLERDGLRCAWQGTDGVPCSARAWLEHDHVIPRGAGGGDHPENVRHLCRAHNRLAAERAFGKATIARIIAQRRSARQAEDGRHAPRRP